MNKKKQKKLSYLRARWDNQTDKTLEYLLKEAHKNLPTTGDRTFKSTSGELSGAKVDDTKNNGIFFQVATYSPDEHASTIDKNKQNTNASIATVPAPAGKDFLNGDCFILVKDNHVIFCSCGARENIATAYFRNILNKSNDQKIGNSLELDKVAKVSKIKMIEKEGVKEIKLNSSIYDASLLQLNQINDTHSLLGKVTKELKHICSKDPSLQEISENENLNISLSIKFDGVENRKNQKTPNFGEIGKRRLKVMAEEIVSDNDQCNELDGFTIITGDNNRITPNEIRVSENFSIETLGKSLNHLDAWKKLEEYFNQLSESGVISE